MGSTGQRLEGGRRKRFGDFLLVPFWLWSLNSDSTHSLFFSPILKLSLHSRSSLPPLTPSGPQVIFLHGCYFCLLLESWWLPKSCPNLSKLSFMNVSSFEPFDLNLFSVGAFTGDKNNNINPNTLGVTEYWPHVGYYAKCFICAI